MTTPIWTPVTVLGNRNYTYSAPASCNGAMVVFLPGAGGTATSTIAYTPTNTFLSLLLSAGFLVVIAEARSNYGSAPYSGRWQTETNYDNNLNPDIAFLNYILDHERITFNIFNPKQPVHRKYIIGGSIGATMADRMAASRDDISGIIVQNGVCGDQAVIDPANPSNIIYNSTFAIPYYHAKTLVIMSSIDAIISVPQKSVYASKLQQEGIQSQLLIGGSDSYHNWDSWVYPFYPTMTAFLSC